MVDRKKFVSFTDIREFRKIQRELPPGQRMHLVLCKADGEVCSGGICSALGDTGIYLFGATSTRGLKTYGSYLVHWRMLEWVRSLGCSAYDLNGIDPQKNPGGYQFKSQLAAARGHEVTFVGQYDAYPDAATRMLIAGADLLRGKLRRGREALAHWS
jgi:lipid II:glycine glycyltransferase (peptidoglycan interpeptide bridge formation enzyme)